jgi:hypothetical protein
VLEPELERTVRQALEPFLSDWRASDVTTEPFELPAVAAVDGLLCVEVDAAVLGDRLVRSGLVVRSGLARLFRGR